jgi:hypothetical protein
MYYSYCVNSDMKAVEMSPKDEWVNVSRVHYSVLKPFHTNILHLRLSYFCNIFSLDNEKKYDSGT